MINNLNKISRKKKQSIILIVDVLLLVMAFWVSFSLRFDRLYVPDFNSVVLWICAPVLLAAPIFIRFGLSRAVIHYVEFNAIWTIAKAVSLYSLVLGVGIYFLDLSFPRSVLILHWMFALVFIIASRAIGQWLFLQNAPSDLLNSSNKTQGRVLVYGAGSAGIQLSRALAYSELQVVAFIDDNNHFHGTNIGGIRVYSPDEIGSLVDTYDIEQVLIAIPSATKLQKKKIIRLLEPLPVSLRILPGVSAIAQGKVEINHIRDVDINDLLGREFVLPSHSLLSANVSEKVVLVTGAGGSIGSELCRQIARLSPTALILYEQSEYNLYALEKELVDHGYSCIPVLGSVVDQNRIERVFKHFGVNTVYHAAAYKHVPLVEHNPGVGITNNILGTYNSAKAAIAAEVEVFVLISTDKAVRPTNVMGASKRFSELVLQGLHDQKNILGHKTQFSMVRFGNVLGSSGSVIPYFKKQIKNGGPVTVTHPDIIRYFMTIPEAAQLVIQAGAMGTGGDVFVLDMGEPVKIMDMARHMIQLSGYEVCDSNNQGGDIEIKITGLRAGEKLYEELLVGDNVIKTDHPLIMRAMEDFLEWGTLQGLLEEVHFVVKHNDPNKVRDILTRAVDGYMPQCGIVDTLSLSVDRLNKKELS